MLKSVHHKLLSTFSKLPFKHVGILILTSDLASNEMSRLTYTKYLAKNSDYDDMLLYKIKLFLEKLLLSRRMEHMEKAVEGIPSLYEPQRNLLDQVISNLGRMYPSTKFSLFKKAISGVDEVYKTMSTIVESEIDHLVVFPSKPAYTCSELTMEFFDIANFLKNNKNNIKFKLSCIFQYSLRKDYTHLIASYIDKGLKSLQTAASNRHYVIVFLAPFHKLQDIKYGDASYLTYAATANNIMCQLNVPNHYFVAWHLNNNNEDKFLMPNVYCAVSHLVKEHKKDSFLFVPLANIFDGRLLRYEYDLDIKSELKKLEPHINIAQLSTADRFPEMIPVLTSVISDHLNYQIYDYPWRLLDKDPDCVRNSCEYIRSILSSFILKPS